MEIRIPKPTLKCPECMSENIKLDHGTTTLYYLCECGNAGTVKITFEDDPLFCNCEICKKIND